MLNCRFSDPSEPFVPTHNDSMKDDLDGLFGGDEDEIFRNLDLSRFDIDDVDLSIFENSYDSEDDSDGECLNSKFREIRNHDCMWGGQCCNKEFQRTQLPTARPSPQQPQQKQHAPVPGVLVTHSSQNKVITIQKCVPASNKCSDKRTDSVMVVRNNVRTMNAKNEGRSLLLNRTNPQQQSPAKTPTPVKREFPTPHSSRPETPQSLEGSDDDFAPIPIDPHNTTSIFRSALDALTTTAPSPWEDDLLSCNKTKDDKPTPPSQNDISRLSASAKSDHNYTSGKNIRLEGLGVDTPSDSEEDGEIDVVSYSEHSSSRSSSCSGLPTRPTPRDQETLEVITTSLLSASAAVSRKLKKTYTSHQTVTKHKRKKYRSESSEDDEDEYDEIATVYRKYHRQTKRQRSSGSPSTTGKRKKGTRFGEEEDSEEKRYLHNNMERMRRIDLRICFEELKALVPTVANKDRAAKVVILREASNYCCELSAESQSKHMQVQALRKEQMRLRSMVSSLRKAAAMACVKTPKRYCN